jgi:aminoglycoside 3-N-acetyltransferase
VSIATTQPAPASEFRNRLTQDLRALGIRTGQTVLVHASLRRLGPAVPGGAATVVAALRAAAGPAGTLAVPAGTAGNSDTSRRYHERTRGMNAAQLSEFRAAMPAFDTATTPSEGMGRIAEFIRTSPGARRSAHPQSSFAALGPLAGRLMDRHSPDCHLGETSPLARLYEERAQVLLLGVDYAACSAFHLAEYRYVPRPPRRTYRCVISVGGAATWWAYEDVDLDDSDLAGIGAGLDQTGLPRRGRVGAAAARLFPLAPAVDFAVEWLRAHRGRVPAIQPS